MEPDVVEGQDGTYTACREIHLYFEKLKVIPRNQGGKEGMRRNTWTFAVADTEGDMQISLCVTVMVPTPPLIRGGL